MSAKAEIDLEGLNRNFRPALIAFFLRRLGNHAEAEDMTQDVFVRLARADRIEMRSPEAYIFQTAANLIRDRARREKHRFDYRGELMADQSAGINPVDPARILSARASLAAVTQALQELPELTRRVFVCHRLENISRPAIGQAFNISESTVDRHLAKAMAFLIARVREE